MLRPQNANTFCKAIYPDTHVVGGVGIVPLADSGGQVGMEGGLL